MELFPAFRGRHLEIPDQLNLLLIDAFPHLVLPDHYRIMDAWLEANPRRRPRNQKRFIVNWLQRQPKPSLKDIQAQRELSVGIGPDPRACGVRMNPAAVERMRARLERR